MILDDIVAYKKIELKERKNKKSIKELEKEISNQSNTRRFLKKTNNIQLIAELKKASPSKGIIREDFNPIELAKICASSGAHALSVLTDEKFFQGSLDYLVKVKNEVNLPLLRKDFIIDEYQIIESRAYGADCILLIANILKLKEMQKFLSLCKDLSMEVLAEVHTEDELKMVADTDAKIIGINNRDLGTFKVDIKNTEKLITNIPKDKLVISESGIFTRSDMLYLEKLGVGAVLVGEAIMSQEDVGTKIKELLGND